MVNSNKSLRATFTALFKDPVNAERAYKLALQKGYKKEDINILMSEETKKKNYGTQIGDIGNIGDIGESNVFGHKMMEGAGVGGAIGTTTGAIAGAIAAIGTTLVLPTPLTFHNMDYVISINGVFGELVNQICSYPHLLELPSVTLKPC